jgi:predicted ATP-grasp superfamily ATP-dependent carboligase
VVKAADSRLPPAFTRKTYIVDNVDDLISMFKPPDDEHVSSFVIQEYIPLESAEDWVYHGYRNDGSGYCISFTGRKLRSYPPYIGGTSLGRSVANEPFRLHAESLLRRISYSGVVDLDYRYDKRNGQYKILDFNPRVGAQFRLFETESGLDVVRACYMDLTGSRPAASPMVEDRTFILDPFDLVSSWADLRRRNLTVHGWWLSLKGKRQAAWFSWDDPRPFFMACLRLLFRVGERAGAAPRRWAAGMGRLPSFGWRGRSAAGGSATARSDSPWRGK